MDSSGAPISNEQRRRAPSAQRLQLGPPVEAAPSETMVLKTADRSKRDEWSEGGVKTLLEVYQSKWVLRNRAKLKGSDWEEIAQQVSDRKYGTTTLKTPNQCKNKIESLKKRYRAESPGSSWQFYAQMDSLLKGNSNFPSKDDVGCENGAGELGPVSLPKLEAGNSEHVLRQILDGSDPQATGKKTQISNVANLEAADHMQDSNGDDRSNNLANDRKGSKRIDSDGSRSKIPNVVDGLEKMDSIKRRKRLGSDLAESIRMLADSVLKIEQARLEMYKDTARMRAEAEIRGAEMDLKRTEIIANTQLQIAELLTGRLLNQSNGIGTSSVRSEHAHGKIG